METRIPLRSQRKSTNWLKNSNDMHVAGKCLTKGAGVLTVELGNEWKFYYSVESTRYEDIFKYPKWRDEEVVCIAMNY